MTGNIFVTGSFRNTVDFDPGIGIFNLTTFASSGDVFLLKLNNITGIYDISEKTETVTFSRLLLMISFQSKAIH